MWQATWRTRDMQSIDTCYPIITPFPPAHMFRGYITTNVPCCCSKCDRGPQTLLKIGLLLCTITYCVFCPPHSCSSALQHIAVCNGLWQHVLYTVGGQELPGVQLLGSVSWPFISPASGLALGRRTVSAGTLRGDCAGKQPPAARTV